jgi:hypothetical protein
MRRFNKTMRTATLPFLLQREIPHRREQPDSHGRILLALEGSHLDNALLKLAFLPCRKFCRRVDILVSNPPKPATQMVARLLLSLERCGIDYRLTSTAGDLWPELLNYLKRFPSISTVLLESLRPMDEQQASALRALRGNGLRLIDLSIYQCG